MNELEMVVKAIETLGEAGQEAFTWWLVKCVAVDLSGTFCWMAFLFLVWKILNPLVKKVIEQDWK